MTIYPPIDSLKHHCVQASVQTSLTLDNLTVVPQRPAANIMQHTMDKYVVPQRPAASIMQHTMDKYVVPQRPAANILWANMLYHRDRLPIYYGQICCTTETGCQYTMGKYVVPQRPAANILWANMLYHRDRLPV